MDMLSKLLQAGWLTNFTNWLREQIIAFFQALSDMLGALIGVWLKYIVGSWLYLIDAIPAPAFLENYSMCVLLMAAGPTVGWVLDTFRIGEGLGLIGAAYGFRLGRKLLTFFQW